MVDESRLKFWLSKYQNANTTLREIGQVTNFYKGLSPAQDVYTFTDGSQKELVNLSGTIPVRYRGSIYNIPICIWLVDTHPNNAPICFVKPTPDMAISVSIYVDNSGKIYLPYLHDWVPDTSELLGLIQVMIVTFGEQPPVFAKSQQQPQHIQDTTPSPFLPYPPASNSFMGYPPYPPASNTKMPQFPQFGTPYPPYPTTGFGGPMPPTNIGGTGTIKDEHIRESLLTAVEEKLLRRMKDQFQQNQAELESLKRTQDELKQGKAKLEGILGRLSKDQSDLDKTIAVLKDKEQELDKAIEKLNGQETIDVDDAVTTTAPLYKQLLNAFAEEAALEDAIYYMGEALRCGVIDLDIFLRQVRTLSRKQFMLRAIMQKCRQKAGLAC